MFKRREAVYYLQPMLKQREAVYFATYVKAEGGCLLFATYVEAVGGCCKGEAAQTPALDSVLSWGDPGRQSVSGIRASSSHTGPR